MVLNRGIISVVIPHLNQPDALGACLASLAAQSLPRDRFEVIVVDNGSATPPDEVVAAHPGARLLHESRPGPGLARNAGVAAARGETLAFIDADCRAHPDWLRNIAAGLAAAGPGVVLGGDVRIWRAQARRANAIEAYESVFAYRFKHYIEKQGYAGTGNLALHRADFDRVGPFGGIEIAEDMDWGKRAGAAGLRFRYAPDMVVFHPARATMRELYAKWDRQIAHYRRMAEQERGWRLRWVLRALLVLASPVAGFVTVMTSDRIEGLAARGKAVAVMSAVRAHRAATMLSLLRRNGAVVWNR
ncbi:Glycosyl transferase family 2 [Rhodoblastus acidophilus]|uniref:Glycosyl transferase family 2 n=1 Tax=Rhodoblastus acidophilus TaxID=1074 RepID=A0A212QNJ4_RHOAC|nr:glycosyltransferase [Rhodoblastus acidophilus]PPQ38921.1 glycosyl transferase [Rhodoblastus acidophilus]RAI20840.1 glycosyl transferase [Rhodoblastus acidophilus]SNB60801.1 Glycosyl transferase family 2 [Rhodoblastus acidophilus]